MAVTFQFDPNQEHQAAAIDAVASVFEGQPRSDGVPPFSLGVVNVVPNILTLSEDTLLSNLQRVQARNNLAQDSALAMISESIETADGRETATFPNFSVEMETGTGKTYVYLRTMMELRRRFGFTKFVIVVPSIAIREGVITTVEALRPHLATLYDGQVFDFIGYDSARLSIIRQFAGSADLSVLLMTVDSFNREANIIRQRNDKLQGEIPLHVLQQARPIIIMDEPQNMESELSVTSIANLHPLCTLRYSATHRKAYNVVFRLTPFDAYRLGLVKRVEVAGIEAQYGEQMPFVCIESINGTRRTVTARARIYKTGPRGQVQEASVTLRPGVDLRALSGLDVYGGYIVDEISANQQCVIFGNDRHVGVGEPFGTPVEPIIEAQIRYTIEEHFRKAARLRPQGIKVLSLFFLSAVADYVADEGFVRCTFDRAFAEIAQRYADWRDVNPESVRSAYFATTRKRGIGDIAQDTSGVSEQDRRAYNLIMRDKARLLSLDEPVSFIFSHSALKEGWDSPNVFQICTLNRTRSNVKKRQEVGRGVRLAVDSAGERVRDERVNVLTVICNESYEAFVRGLQDETAAEFGSGNEAPAPRNARKRATARLKKESLASAEFLQLWNRISARTRYRITIDSQKLVDDVVTGFQRVELPKPQVVVSRAEVNVWESADEYVATASVSNKALGTFAGPEHVRSVIDIALDLLERTTPPLRVTRKTLYEIYRRTGRSEQAASNPQLYAEALVNVVREKLIDQVVDGITYVPNGTFYVASRFDAEIESWESALVPVRKSIYDHVIIDGDSDVERKFALALDARGDIKLFFKLPSWFRVATPVGDYVPDWAVVKEQRDEFGQPTGEVVYVIRETKGSTDSMSLRRAEYLKTLCGESHFRSAIKMDYAVVTAADQV